MKKVYIAPDVKLAVHGTLESVFASGAVSGRSINWAEGSGEPTLSPYCKDANSWMLDNSSNPNPGH